MPREERDHHSRDDRGDRDRDQDYERSRSLEHERGDRERDHRHRPYERDAPNRRSHRDDDFGRSRDGPGSGPGGPGEMGGPGSGGPGAGLDAAAKPKEAPNFGVSGALTAEANTFKGVVLKYAEPPEARKPSLKFRLYAFKGDEQIDMIQVSRQSAYLFGRERLVADIPVDHPSISKQHAVLQYRSVSDKDTGRRKVKPYIIDLDSANGTSLNGAKLEPSRYYELKTSDVIKFGFSSRDWVIMAEDEANS